MLLDLSLAIDQNLSALEEANLAKELSSNPIACWSQWYHARSENVENEPILAPLLKVAHQTFPGQALRIDCQSNFLGPGSSLGIPVWQTASWAADGGAILLFHGEEKFLEIDEQHKGVVRPKSGSLIFLSGNEKLRFLPLTKQQEAGLILVRPRKTSDPEPIHRYSARVFSPPHPQQSPLSEPRPVPDSWDLNDELHFHSQVEFQHQFEKPTVYEIAHEPSIFPMPIADALSVGGPLLRRFVEVLPANWREENADVVVEVQRNELDVGWSPALLWWHLDGTSRANKLPDGRPNLKHPGRTVEQMLACFGPTASTRFLQGDVHLPNPPVGVDHGLIKEVWQHHIARDLASGKIKAWTMNPDTMVKFGFGGFHTTSPSHVSGWRCIIKAMRGRGGESVYGRRLRGNISWPITGPSWPLDPCGVFPDFY